MNNSSDSDQDEQTPQQTRRSVLGRGYLWLRWLVGTLLLYPALKFIDFSPPKKPKLVKVSKDVPIGGFVVELDFILFVDKDGPRAISRKCTHLGCRLNFQTKENVLLCPCHQSRFTTTGNRISGPAKIDLPSYPVKKMSSKEGKGYIVSL
jgi:cytochrome b6-f complex iron-sulfur subunit